MKDIRCIAFDFDGTLVDSRQLAWDILNELANKYGFRRLESKDFDAARDMNKAQFIRFLGVKKLRVPRLLNEGRLMMRERIHTVKPFEGIADVISAIRPELRTLGIITSNIPENVEKVLQAHDLNRFEFISSVPKLGKKHKYLRYAMRTFSYAPERVVCVGDESRDMVAAKRAGVTAVGVAWGFNSEKALREAQADYIVQSPVELKELLLTL